MCTERYSLYVSFLSNSKTKPPNNKNTKLTCRAANWNLTEPTWTGRMRLVTKGVNVTLKLEDKVTGALYANCPIETYPGNDIDVFPPAHVQYEVRTMLTMILLSIL